MTELTPAELQKLTQAELIAIILDDQRIDASLPIERDKYGNSIRQLQRTKDAYGKVVEERVIRWTYYDAEEGIVDEIIVEDDKEQLVVKHHIDGRQPTAVKRLIAELTPIPLER